MQVDAAQAREYRKRFEAVAGIEEAELRRMTPEERWERFCHLVGMASALGLGPGEVGRDREVEDEPVRRRWVRLRGARAPA